MSYLVWAALAIVGISILAVPLRLAASVPTTAETFSWMAGALLLIAGIFSAVMTLMILAAAAWGMDTGLPWGLGVYPYLIPALSLPAFFLLRISAKALSRAFWLLTIACAIAWYVGDRADRVAQGLHFLSGPREIVGMFFNAFTILFILISTLVQLAAICKKRQKRLAVGPESD